MNAYEILNVDHNSSDDEIKLSHKKLSRKFHPDINPNQNATEKFIEVTNAYNCIKTKELRSKYNRYLDLKLDITFDLYLKNEDNYSSLSGTISENRQEVIKTINYFKNEWLNLISEITREWDDEIKLTLTIKDINEENVKIINSSMVENCKEVDVFIGLVTEEYNKLLSDWSKINNYVIFFHEVKNEMENWINFLNEELSDLKAYRQEAKEEAAERRVNTETSEDFWDWLGEWWWAVAIGFVVLCLLGGGY